MDTLAEVAARCHALISAAGGASAAALDEAATALRDTLAALPLPAELPLTAALKQQVVDALNAAEQARIAIAYHADRNRRGVEALASLAGAQRSGAYGRTGFA